MGANLYLPIYTPCWMLPIRTSSTMPRTGKNGLLFSTMRPHRLMPTMRSVWPAGSMGRAMTCWRCTADTMVCNCLHGKTTLRLA